MMYRTHTVFDVLQLRGITALHLKQKIPVIIWSHNISRKTSPQQLLIFLYKVTVKYHLSDINKRDYYLQHLNASFKIKGKWVRH